MDVAEGVGLPVSAAVGHGWYCGLFYGALGILLAYSLFFAIQARERAHFYYSVLVTACGVAFAGIDRAGIQQLWPGLSAITAGFPLLLAVALWASLQLTLEMLAFRETRSRLDRTGRMAARILIALFVVVMLLSPSWLDWLVYVVPPAVATFLLFVALKCPGDARLAGGLLVASWGVFFAGAVLAALVGVGVLLGGVPALRFAQAGILLVAVLLSLAQVNLLRHRRQAQARSREQSRLALEAGYRQLRDFDNAKTRFLAYLGQVLDVPAGERIEDPDAEAVRRRVARLLDGALCYFDLAGESESGAPLVPVTPMWLVDDILLTRAHEIACRQLQARNRVPPELTLMASERRLRRILDVLIDNAIRHGGDCNELVVLGGIADDDRNAGIGTGWLTVRDDGRGLDPGQTGSLFEPFFFERADSCGRAAPHPDGRGLGLVLARRLARTMGGDLVACGSAPGRGAAFTLTLPAAVSGKSPLRRQQSPVA